MINNLRIINKRIISPFEARMLKEKRDFGIERNRRKLVRWLIILKVVKLKAEQVQVDLLILECQCPDLRKNQQQISKRNKKLNKEPLMNQLSIFIFRVINLNRSFLKFSHNKGTRNYAPLNNAVAPHNSYDTKENNHHQINVHHHHIKIYQMAKCSHCPKINQRIHWLVHN